MFRVENVTFRYGSVLALDRVSIEIQEGKRSALLGANGSGKSTLLRMLDGLCFPDSGKVSFRGDSIDALSFEDDQFALAFRRRVGLVFQNPDVQLFNPTVFDEVAFGPLQMPKQIGYICFLKDPDGNTIEFSFDQGVYEKARDVWGKAKAPA